MAIYTVHARSTSESGDPSGAVEAGLDARFVRDGFSWGAFLFGGLWLLFRGLWLALVVYVALLLGLGLVFDRFGAGGGPMAAFILLAHLWFGFEGRSMVAEKLTRRGMPAVAVVEAGRQDDAERRYFSALALRGRAPVADADSGDAAGLAGASEGL